MRAAEDVQRGLLAAEAGAIRASAAKMFAPAMCGGIGAAGLRVASIELAKRARGACD